MRTIFIKKTLLLTVAATVLLAPLSPAAYAAQLPQSVMVALQAGAQRGPNQLLSAVYNASMAYPELSSDIVQMARQYQPSLTRQIAAAARNGMNNGQKMTYEAKAMRPADSGMSAGGWALVGLGAAALAGGGIALAAGGSDSDSDPTPTQLEFNANYGLGMINASAAYARGATGSGVTVAVVDSGIDTDHREFDDMIAAGGQNFVGGSTASDIEDNLGDGHGTFVSGIIAGNKDSFGMQGVAYDAQILPIRIFDADAGSGVATAAETADAIDYAVAQGVQVINGSYGFSGTPDIASLEVEFDSYVNAINAGAILVFAAGNDAYAEPNLPAGLPYVKPANNGAGLYVNNANNRDYSATASGLLAVASVDENGSISSFSNRCGIAATWCLAAPGGDIYSSQVGGDYATQDGTSFAAPHVAGAVALLLDLYPSLTPAQVVTRLLATTTKSGIYSNTAVYGQGLLNLNTATAFVAQARVTTGATRAAPSFELARSGVSLGSAFGDGLRASLADTTLRVNDTFDGALIPVKADSLMRLAEDSNQLRDGFSRFGLDANVMRFGAGDQATLSYRNVPTSDIVTQPGRVDRRTKTEARLEMSFGGGSGMSVGYMDDPAMGFGLMAHGDVSPFEMRSSQAFLSPYMGFAADGVSTAITRDMGRIGALRIGSFFGESADDTTSDSKGQSFGALVEYEARPSAHSRVAAQLGMMSETETFLGTRTSGAFASGGTDTMFGGLSGKLALAEKTELVGTYFLGFSSATAAPNSLLSGFSGLQSNSFSVGLVQRDVMREGDRFGFAVNQPLRVSGGTASLRLPSGGDQSGGIYYSSTSANLAPTGREIDLEGFYATSLSEKTKLNASLMYRHEPDHVAEADGEGQALVRVQYQY